MSISSEVSRNNYTGNGSVNEYDYTFKILDDDHLIVTVRNTSDVEATLTKATDYTVVGVGVSGGGSITLVSSGQAWLTGGNLTTGYVISIRRVIPVTQTTDIRNQGDFYPEAHEDAFDKLAMQNQQQQDELDRTPKMAESVDPADFDNTFPAGIVGAANVVPMTNATGDGWAGANEWPSGAEISGASAAATAAGVSAAAALVSENAALVSENAAAASEAAALASENAAAASEAAALVSENAAAASEAAALVSENAAAASEAAALVSENAAAASEAAALASENAAAASESAVLAAVDSILWSDVVYIDHTDSPYAITSSDRGKLFVVDASTSTVSITLPEISTLSLSTAFSLGIKKKDETVNAVTISAHASDKIDTLDSITLEIQNAGVTLVPDTDATPDEWVAIYSGAVESSSASTTGIILGDNSNFERSEGDWLTYADAAGTQPVDGTAGSANITATRTTTGAEVLNGDASLKIAKDAADRQGEGASLDITVPNYIKGLPCKVKFAVQASANFDFGTAFDYSDPSDVTVYLYDVTNSKLIQPYPYTIMSEGIFEGMFQIPTDCNSLRLILHVTTTNASAWDLFIDDVEIAPALNETVAADSDWETWTPTGSWVANTTYTGRFKKMGDMGMFHVEATCSGAPTSTSLTITLPTGLELDTTKLEINADTQTTLLSFGDARNAGTAAYAVAARYTGTATAVNIIALDDATYIRTVNVTQAIPFTFGSTDTVTVTFMAPIKGWTTGQVTAASANLNAPVVCQAYKSGGSSTATDLIGSWTGVQKDTVSGFNASTGEYTVKVPGDYFMEFNGRHTTASGIAVGIYKNGSMVASGVSTTTGSRSGVSATLTDLKVGDVLSPRVFANAGTFESNTDSTRFSLYRIETSNRVYKTRVAYIKDVKAANTAGGTFTSGAWRTRVLNTLEGDTSFVSLASNQFTLQPGTYHIEASAPGLLVDRHKAILYNVTDTANEILGLSAFSDNTSAYAQTSSLVSGTFSITSAKVFEIRHMCETTQASNGFGTASNFSVSEIYTQVKLEKVL
jgi:hypothetical protein